MLLDRLIFFEVPIGIPTLIVRQDVPKARSSGRLLVYENKLYRFGIDVSQPVGKHQVMVYEFTDIAPDSYSEKLAQKGLVVMASGSGWNGQAMD